MHLPRLVIIALCIMWSFPVVAEDRTAVHLFQYGRTNTPAMRAAFQDFHDLLVEKLPKLAAEMLKADIGLQTQAKSSLEKLSLKSVRDNEGVLMRPEFMVASVDEKRNYWLQTGALGVLTGHIRQQEQTLYANTTFYWGQLKGPFPDEVITLKLPLVGETFDTTSDSHSIAVLYALAQEARQGCNHVADAIKLLSEAHKRAKSITEDFQAMGSELEVIVVDAIESIKGECSNG